MFEASYSVEKTTMAALVIEAEAQSATVIGEEGDPQIPAAILVTVGDSYKSLELSSDIDTDVFAGGGGWYYVSDGAHSDDSTLANILDGTYYGEFDVKVDIGYGISYSGGVLQARTTASGNLHLQAVYCTLVSSSAGLPYTRYHDHIQSSGS